jgi:large subunit ribosomal protein L25
MFMSTIVLEAETRTDMGKGASRRLRRLENKIPAVVYGGDKDPQSIHLLHNKVVKALETESIYSSVFDLKVDGKAQRVILKAIQRHPYKPIIMHMDLQRVSAKDVLVKQVPLHFINEDTSKGVKAGGRISHSMTQIEVRCPADKLPEFIEVDMKNVDMNDVIHILDIKLPKGVELTIDKDDLSHNLAVVSIHAAKGGVEEAEKVEEKAEPKGKAEAEKKTGEGE